MTYSGIFAELTSGMLSAPRRIQASNLSLPLATPARDNAEPGVEVRVQELNKPEVLADGKVIRTLIATSKFPASNNGHGEIDIEAAPAPGIVLPNGINTYYLDFAPGMEYPLHQTTSLDFLTVVEGELSLVTPVDEEYTVQDGKGTYKSKVYNVAKQGDVIAQRGIVHGLANRTEKWVRVVVVIIDSDTNRVPTKKGSMRTLDDIFLA